jgi:hypothetical protein
MVLDADVASDAKTAVFSDLNSIISSGISRGWAIANMQNGRQWRYECITGCEVIEEDSLR